MPTHRATTQTILFDFDGVLCRHRFYGQKMQDRYPEEYAWIQRNIFQNHEIMSKWMRNQLTSEKINDLIAEQTGIDMLRRKHLTPDDHHVMGKEAEHDLPTLAPVGTCA